MNNKNTIFIGIIEEKQYTINLLKKLLMIFNYQLDYSNTKNNIFLLNKNEINLVLITMKTSEIEFFQNFGIEFHFLVVNIFDYEFNKKEIFKYQFKDCNYYIINSDEDNLSSILPLDPLNGIVITYGFNSKATMTISSYIIEQVMEASLCLQRDIVTLYGERISPFEFIIEINSKNKDHIYSVLAVSILAILLGEKLQFKNNLKI
ncbi:MAG: hypothetical protein RIN55_06090 [Tissierellaceae bacterium]|nr:hypothetical protein [Tissierellaceae bacterium]